MKDCGVTEHYDCLILEDNDPVHDPAPLKAYMDKWDGRAFTEQLRLKGDEAVLEIGVGTGRLAVKTAPLSGTFCGIDISPLTVERARVNLNQYPNVTLVCGDFMSYDFEYGFDVIYSSLTFMHIENKQAAISKAASLLHSGGRFVLSIDKSREEYINVGARKVKIYPDTPDAIVHCCKLAHLSVKRCFETEFAYIITSEKSE